jgi:rod shape-determining protein MreD
MGPAFAAIGAAIAALLEVTIASRYELFGAQLQLVLVMGVAVTVVYGFEIGMAWAFVGGLLADFLSMRPLGSTPFELLIVLAVTELASPLLNRSRYPGVIGTVAVLTPVYVVLAGALTGLLNPPSPSLHPGVLLAAAAANAILAALLSPAIIGLKRRSELRERVVWWR